MPRVKLIPVRLISDTPVQYETEGGQRVDVILPRGTKLKVPTDWIYSGVQATDIDTKDLLEGGVMERKRDLRAVPGRVAREDYGQPCGVVDDVKPNRIHYLDVEGYGTLCGDNDTYDKVPTDEYQYRVCGVCVQQVLKKREEKK